MAVVLTLLVLSAAWVAAWWSTQRTEYFPEALWRTTGKCDPIHDVQPYPEQVMDDFKAGWYGGVLSDFHEPSLWRREDPALRSVRFTWIRSFDDPVIVRLDTQADGTMRLTAKQQPTGLGMSSWARKGQHRELSRTLTIAESRAAAAAVASSGLFASEPGVCSCCTDGARWIIEGADPTGGYRFRDVQSPQVGPERDLALSLLGLTGWDFGRLY